MMGLVARRSKRRSKRERRFVSSRRCLDERLLGNSASQGTTWHQSSAARGTSGSVERLAGGLGVDVYVLTGENETVLEAGE